MFESTGDYLRQKAEQLGLSRLDALTKCQNVLNGLYPEQTRVLSLNQQILKVITPSATVAGDMRLRQVELLIKLRQATSPHSINSLNIQIRELQ